MNEGNEELYQFIALKNTDSNYLSISTDIYNIIFEMLTYQE